MNTRRLPWELIGAAVGAGLASGREIASFFGQYGPSGFIGVLMATAVTIWLADALLPESWCGRWPEHLWQTLLSLLLVVTGGAMLAACGDLSALTFPFPGAHWLGLALTLTLAWLLALRIPKGLMWLSRALLAALAVLILTGLTIPTLQAASIPLPFLPGGLIRGMCYGGFTAALMHPVLSGSPLPHQRRQQALLGSCLLLALLLSAGQAVLLRHPLLLQEPLPFVRMASILGRPGFWLSAVSLYLAALSTLTVCLRSLKGRFLPVTGVVLIALAGFTGAVDAAYPLLGGSCALMLLSMRLHHLRTVGRAS